MLYPFNYLAPKSKTELLRAITDNLKNYKILAGGTDLMIALREKSFDQCVLIDVKKIKEFNKIEFSQDTGLSIGPAVTVDEIIKDKTVRKYYPLLVLTAEQLGSVQVRNRATVVGNICNASPCADMAMSLLCLDAEVLITSKDANRVIKLKDFFTGVKKTVLKSDEYVEKIIIPFSQSSAKGGFKKLKRIKGHDISLTSVCLQKKGSVIRIALGSVNSTPYFLGEFKSKTSVDDICKLAEKSVKPIGDIRCSKDYRLFMMKHYIEELMKEIKR